MCTSLLPQVTLQVCPGRDGGQYGRGGHAKHDGCRTGGVERGRATPLPTGLGPLQGYPTERGLEREEEEERLQPERVDLQARGP